MDTEVLSTVGASIAGVVVAKAVCFPLDTVAVQFQTSTRRALSSITLREYYRGINVAVLMAIPGTASFLTTRSYSQDYLVPHLGQTNLTYALSGMTAEIASSFFFTPMEVVKTRLQIAMTAEHGKLRYQLSDIMRTEGVRGFYRGYWMGIGSYIPYNALYWPIYENIKQRVGGEDKELGVMYAAGVSGACGAAFIHPLELVKTRYQVATSPTKQKELGKEIMTSASDKDGLRQVVRNVFSEGGIKGFYRGFVPTFMRSVPSQIITMSVYEYLKPKRDNLEKVM